MVNFQILWSGFIKLENVQWIGNGNGDYVLGPELEKEREWIWDHSKTQHPLMYDGNLLFLDEFIVTNSKIDLHISGIRFSTLLVLEKFNYPIIKGFGVLGVQCAILSPDSKYILVGKRSLLSSYCPGLITLPGGMLEFFDAQAKPSISLLREINEEVTIPFQSVSIIALLREHNFRSVIVLMETKVPDGFDFTPQQHLSGKGDEWEGELYWLNQSNLMQFPSDTILEGLSYYQSYNKH